MGVYVPECKADGGFEAVQCNMAAGYCWCVDDSGTEVKGSKVRGRPRCGKAIYNSRGLESHVNEKAFFVATASYRKRSQICRRNE